MDLGENLNFGHMAPYSPHAEIEIVGRRSGGQEGKGFSNSFICVSSIKEIPVSSVNSNKPLISLKFGSRPTLPFSDAGKSAEVSFIKRMNVFDGDIGHSRKRRGFAKEVAPMADPLAGVAVGEVAVEFLFGDFAIFRHIVRPG
jgi:hypothetical protein